MPQFVSIDACLSTVLNILNGTSPVLGLSTVLTYEQCLQYCGDGYGTYQIWMIVNSLTDWVIPLFLLLGNITYSKSASQIYTIRGFNYGAQLNWIAVVSHLLVNPLDFLWSLALKLDSGREIKDRIDQINRPRVLMTSEQKKYLCGICYALEDFENGIHVDALLHPFENGTTREAKEHWDAIQPILESTARDIAGGRRQNKFHSVLAIIVYGKDVFVALIQAKLQMDFPYQMPHTLALRQLYYWLFCAIILSSAAGGFADQWSSHAFLDRFLQARLENLKAGAYTSRYGDIVLKPIEPWNGGNYNWKYTKRGQKRKKTPWKRILLYLAIAAVAVAVPVIIAFIMSWETPTTGLGDRGIMELSFCGMWLLNFLVTIGASFRWHGKDLFNIYIWNSFWSLASLYILFGAFQGEFCSKSD
jgi:hypothetical protein